MSDLTKQWHYSVNGQNLGPFSPDQMRAFLAAGTVNGNTMVWASPMQEWVPLSRTDLTAAPRQAPPVAGQAPARPQAPGGPVQISIGGKTITVPEAVQQVAPPEFLQAVKTCLEKYTDFSGRAARPEFWWFYLFSVIVIVAAMILDWIVSFVVSFSIFQLLASLALIVPQIAAGARRLHDTDRSGWLQLISLTIIGLIPLIYWLCQPGTKEQNRFG